MLAKNTLKNFGIQPVVSSPTDCLNNERLEGETTVLVLAGADYAGANGTYRFVLGTRVETASGCYATLDEGTNVWTLFSETDQPLYENALPDFLAPWTLHEFSTATTPPTGGLEVGTVFAVGDVVRVVDQAGRIEQFLGGDASDNASWLVLRNTVHISLTSDPVGEQVEINGVLYELSGTPTVIGWVDPYTAYQSYASNLEEWFISVGLAAPYPGVPEAVQNVWFGEGSYSVAGFSLVRNGSEGRPFASGLFNSPRGVYTAIIGTAS